MDQLKDALKFLAEQAVAAHTAVIKSPAEPSHVYYIREGDGALHKREADAAPRAYHGSSLADLAKLYAEVRMGDDPLAASGDVKAIAFVGGDLIEIVLDERGSRRERLLFKLTITQALGALRGLLTSSRPIDQQELIQLLRIQLHGCVDKATIQLLRSLKNTKTGGGESTFTASTKALNRSVVIEASAGGGEVPDEIIVNTSIYEQFAIPKPPKPGVEAIAPKRYPIRCGLVMDVETFEFALIPLAGELDQAYLAEEQRIAEELRFLVEKNNCTVVCGLAN